jgi:acyl carrier protein
MSDVAAVRSESEVREVVDEIVRELAPNPKGGDSSAAQLVDALEYTSLALLELAFTLEDEFELAPIDEETARGIRTVADVQEHVIKGLRGEGRLAD